MKDWLDDEFDRAFFDKEEAQAVVNEVSVRFQNTV